MLEFILYMLAVIIGISLLAIVLIGALLFVVVWVVAMAEALAHSMFRHRR
jgi:hypothetical protein